MMDILSKGVHGLIPSPCPEPYVLRVFAELRDQLRRLERGEISTDEAFVDFQAASQVCARWLREQRVDP